MMSIFFVEIRSQSCPFHWLQWAEISNALVTIRRSENHTTETLNFLLARLVGVENDSRLIVGEQRSLGRFRRPSSALHLIYRRVFFTKRGTLWAMVVITPSEEGFYQRSFPLNLVRSAFDVIAKFQGEKAGIFVEVLPLFETRMTATHSSTGHLNQVCYIICQEFKYAVRLSKN